MPKSIKDEFTDLKISRQRRYQLRRERDGKCVKCGADAEFFSLCFNHAVKKFLHQRQKRAVDAPIRSKLLRALRESIAQRREAGKSEISELMQGVYELEPSDPTLPE